MRRLALLLAALLSGGNLLLPRIPLLAAFLLVLALVFNPAKLLRPELGRIWMLLLAVLAVSLVGSEGFYLEATAVRYANFLTALLLLMVYLDLPRATLIDDLRPILIFFSIQSILTPVLAALIPEAFITFEIDDAIYYTLGFVFTYHETVVAAIKRPDGFFFEPGVLQIYLNIFLFTALFLYRRPRLIALALAAVLATQSTTGIIIAMVLCAAAAWTYMKTAGINNRLIVVILAPVLLAPLALFARENLTEKLVGTLSGSTVARQYDFQAGIRIVQAYPVFGIGFDYERYRDISGNIANFKTGLSKEAAQERTSSNGLLLLTAMLGIPMFLVFMWGLFRQRFLPNRWLVFLLFFLGFIGEALILTPFFLLFIFSGFVTARRAAAPRPAPALRTA